MKRTLALFAVLAAAAATPAAAQLGGRFSVQPYAGYGFFGTLPEGGPRLKESVAYGGRAAYQLSDQFALIGNFQRSQSSVEGIASDREAAVDHWSAGVEFSYVPRGGAEGMLPVLLEAGLGQVRYGFEEVFGTENDSDLAANIGVGSALQLSRNFAIRYGANDYISNYADQGVVNQIFVNVGAEFTF